MSAPHSAVLMHESADVFHVERTPSELNASHAVMYCGASCWLDAEGTPVPALDWYDEAHASRATCGECRALFFGASEPLSGGVEGIHPKGPSLLQ